MDRRTFLEDRQRGLGGTDVPVLLGLVANRNALDLFHVKTRPLSDVDDQDTIDTLRGKSLEDMARSHYWAATGRKGRNIKKATTHPDFPAYRCHLDFDIFADENREEGLRGPGVGETKCPRAFVLRKISDHGLRQTELVQGMTYCAVSRREWCGFNFFSLEWDGGPVLAVDVPADRALGDYILEVGQRFWDEHVLARVPPDPAEWRLIGKDIEEQVRESTGELFTIIDERFAELGSEILSAKNLLKNAKEALAEKQDRLLAWIEEHSPSDRNVVPDVGKFTVVRSDGRKTLSRDALALHRPIDRDKLRAHMMDTLLNGGLPDRWRTDEEVAEVLLELELDISRFDRIGEPFSFLKTTSAQ